MESVQCVRNEEISVQLSLEEKARLDEIMKQAEFSLESQELLDQSIGVVAENECLDKAAAATKLQVLAGALMNYQTKGPLSVMATKKYAGHIVINFPKSLTSASAGAFAMSAMSDKGVKAAVVYSGKNKAGVECGWLLAFADTKTTGKRIYADCGRKGNFININWADVEHKLNNAGQIYAKHYDMETGTSLYAGIAGIPGELVPGAVLSVVGAAFVG